MIICLKKNNSYKHFISVYNKSFFGITYFKKKIGYNVRYPIYYRKVYYFTVTGNLPKIPNSLSNPNKCINLRTFIAKNKISYFFPIKLPNLIIE